MSRLLFRAFQPEPAVVAPNRVRITSQPIFVTLAAAPAVRITTQSVCVVLAEVP